MKNRIKRIINNYNNLGDNDKLNFVITIWFILVIVLLIMLIIGL